MVRYRIICVLALLIGCSDPGVREYEPHSGIIRGTVLYPAGAQRGNAIVLLFREDDPPPPQGSGRPLNFVVVPKSELFGDSPAGMRRDFSAGFTMPTVPPGRYQIRAFLDADEDFNPIYDLLAQPTAGDVGGGHVDTTTGTFLTIEVEADRALEGVIVSLGYTIPVERPAFVITSTPSYAVPLARPGLMRLLAHPIERAQVRMDPDRTRFLVTFADDDADGVPDDKNGDHLPDLYPRVLMRRIAEGPSVIVPLILSPVPYRDAIETSGATLTTALDLIVPPVAVQLDGTATQILPEIPTGEYEVIVISATGQTWQVPNDLDRIQPGETDPTQSVKVIVEAGPPLPSGSISGTLRVETEAEADGYVFAFREDDPPPPQGTGRPVAFASVSRAELASRGGAREASFTLRGVPAGRYILGGLYDLDGNFSPLADLFSQASAGDLVGGARDPIAVAEGQAAEGASIVLGTALPFERPAFAISGGTVKIPRGPAPRAIEIESHAIAALDHDPDRVRFPVMLANRDEDGDNFPDLLPRVLLSKIDDRIDPRRAGEDLPPIVIPAVIDPMPFLVELSRGQPFATADRLRLILPPVAFQVGAGGALSTVFPVPSGRYRVNVLSPFGQTWSVPNDLDLALGRVGTDREDPTQAAFVEIENTPVPPGAISGQIQLAVAPPEGDFQVVVFAFAKGDPPPPEGRGRPIAVAVVRKDAFRGGTNAPYALGGLPSGMYTVRAFLDADDDFTPWFSTHEQPDAGDVGGGHLNGFALGEVEVVLGAPAIDKTVVIPEQLRFATDRPVFTVASDPMLDRNGGPITVRLTVVRASSDLLRADGVFPVQWIDLDRNRQADDINGDMNPDVYPIVVAELLDGSDPSGLTPASQRVLIFGFVSPLQFQAAGFPATDPTATSSVVLARELEVAFPPIAVDGSTGRPIGAPPPGSYRINVINGAGQTWSVPNELVRAAGDPLALSQARRLVVR
jgi:hypothetical protein